MYSINAKTKNKKGTDYEGMAVSDSTSTSSTISISNFLELVKDKFADGFSDDVLESLEMERREGQYNGITKYSLPSPKLLNYQINNWRNGSEQQDAEPQQRGSLQGRQCPTAMPPAKLYRLC